MASVSARLRERARLRIARVAAPLALRSVHAVMDGEIFGEADGLLLDCH